MTRKIAGAGIGVTFKTLLACGVAAAGLTGFAGVAHAQGETGVDVGELVVTARKREERLRDVPIAASVVDAESVEKRAAVDTTGAIVTSTPGARFNDLTSSTLSEVSMRGSGTARGTNAETGIGLYANGVYVGGGLQFARNYTKIDFFDLGRAEVLRGTLGALYGRNAVGGAINLISQQPVLDNTGKIQLDYGPDIQKKQVIAIGNFRMADNFAIRVGMDFIDQDHGVYEEFKLGRAVDEQHGLMFRLQGRYVGEKADATLMVQRSDLTIGGGAATPNVPAGTGCPATATSICYLRDYTQEPGQHPFSTHSHVEQGVQQAILTFNYDLGWAELTSVTSLRERVTQFVSDSDLTDAATIADMRARGIITGGANARQDSYQDLKDDSVTYYQDVHLAGGADRFTWMVGGEWLRIGSKYRIRLITANPNGTMGSSRLSYHSWAAYGAVGYDLTDTLNLSGELRYTDDRKTFSTLTYNWPALSIAVPQVDRAFESTNWSYNLVANWKFAQDWIAYAKVGTGYRAGGFNSGAAVLPPNVPPRPLVPTFGVEETLTYEAGAKGNLLPSLYVTLAGYKSKTEGAITQVDNGCFLGSPVCNLRPTNYAINGGDADIWGVELEGVMRYDLGAINGSLRGSVSRQEGVFEGGAYDGFEVAQTPDWLYSANIDANMPLGEATLFGNLNYRGQRGGVEGVAVGAEPPKDLQPYDILDLRAGIRWGQYELAGYVNNLTDELFTFIDSGTSVRWSPHRTWGIQARYRW